MNVELTREDHDGELPSLSESLQKLSKEEIHDLQINKLREIKVAEPEKAKALAKKLNINPEEL